MEMIKKKDSIKGMTMTASAGMIFGCLPIFTNIYLQFGADVDSFNLYGFLLSVLLLGGYIAVKKISFSIPKKSAVFVLLAGFFNAITRILLTYSYLFLDVGVATTLHFLYPLFAALLGRVFFKDKMPLYKWVLFIIASASVSLFTTSYGGGQMLGVVLALASSVCFALYMLTTEKAQLTDMNPLVFVFYVSVVSAICCVGMGLGKGQLLVAIPAEAIITLVLCTIVINVVGFALQQQGVRYLGAAMAAVFSLFEPIFSCVFGGLFLGQKIGAKVALGIVLILASLAAMVILDNRKQNKLFTQTMKTETEI